MSRRNEGNVQVRMEIPVNTRAVGEPTGSYLLYLEDYVHTFIRKIQQENAAIGREGEVFLYGYEFEEQGRHYLIVSGAMDKGAIQMTGERFFPSCYCVGEALVREGRDMQLAMEVVLQNGRKLVLNDFYIYYDQNEEMQNYLIEWNLNRNKGRIRKEEEPAVQLGRVAQAYNREEARINYLWNTMNLLSMGLIVCIMAFGVISINNYHKMKQMESKIAYALSLPQDALAVMNSQEMTDNVQEPEQWESSEEETQDNAASVIEETSEDVEIQIQSELAEDLLTTMQDEMPESTEEQQIEVVQEPLEQQEAAATVTYYIVQEGDTLRTISYQVYGTYSKVPEICRWNGIEDADSILYGQKLLLH